MKNAKIALFSLITLILPLESYTAQANNASLIPNVVLQYVANNKEFKNFVFFSLIAKRCYHFMPLQDIDACREAVSKMIAILDTDILFPEDLLKLSPGRYVPGKFLFIAFKKVLIDLLNEKDTETYLISLNEEMSQYMLGQNPSFNLWTFTLKYFNSSEKASMIIASLFQDTSEKKLHLAFLETSQMPRGRNFKTNKDLLSRTIDTINLLLDDNEANFHELAFPPKIKKNLNRSLYHFYVPLYLTKQLSMQGTQKKMSFTAPLLMTLTYEFITAADDYRYIFSDPEYLDPIKHDWKIKDIYAGYQGAAMGVSKKDTPTLRVLKDKFSTSTKNAVKSMLVQ